MVATDAILARRPPQVVIDEIPALMRELACDPAVAIDPEVAQSKADTGFRNTSLANDGIDPLRRQRVVDAQAVRRINATMMTCGHYDTSGNFAFRVGLPGKSGAGGDILAIARRRASIAVWSPGLNTSGNSLIGALAFESLSRRTGWSVF